MMEFSTIENREEMSIFEINLQDTFTRFEKHPSKLDISRSFIRIFVEDKTRQHERKRTDLSNTRCNLRHI